MSRNLDLVEFWRGRFNNLVRRQFRRSRREVRSVEFWGARFRHLFCRMLAVPDHSSKECKRDEEDKTHQRKS